MSVMIVSLITASPITVEAASNIKINGVNIGYASGDYFTKNGKSCANTYWSKDENGKQRCHGHGVCVTATDKECNCMRYWPTGDPDTAQVDLKAVQCKGFAEYCQWIVYGYCDKQKLNKFQDLTKALYRPSGEKLKEKLMNCSPATHIRTYDDKHSIVIISTSKDGVVYTDCNSDGYCKIRKYFKTWDEFSTKLKENNGIKFAYAAKEAMGKPLVPTITSAEAKSSTSIEVKWKSVAGATKYRVDRRIDISGSDYETLTDSCTDLSFVDKKGLKANTVYFYRIYAINSAGISGKSTTYRACTMTNAPGEPKVNADSDSQLTISWDKVDGATGYELKYRQADKPDSVYTTLKTNISASTTSYTHKGLSAGTKYCYRVIALKKAEVGNDGDRHVKTIKSKESDTKSRFTKISRPLNSINNDNINQVNLEWEKVAGDKSYKYRIYRDGQTIAETDGLKYTDNTAVSGKIHRYEIKALDTTDSKREVAWSGEFYAASKIEPGVSVTPQSPTSMKIGWNKPTGVNDLSYTVMRQIGNSESVAVKTVKDNYYIDSGLTTGTTYGYYVKVLDSAGNYLTSIRGKNKKMEFLPTAISLNKSSSTIKVGESVSLTATITPTNATSKMVSWTSSNSNVATVSNGIVTAKSEGDAVITAKTSNGKTATCSIKAVSAGCTHTYGEWMMSKESTCTENGEKYRTCIKCNDEKEIVIIPATDHSYSEEWTVIIEPTCLQEGSKVHLCTICGEATDYTAIDTIEHSFGNWMTVSEHSCIEEGTEYRICSVCKSEETRVVEAKDHSYELTEEIETTLDAAGSRTYTCSICSYSFTEEYLHEVNEGIITIGNATPKPGETITIPVSISENPGIAGMQLVLEYDDTVLTPIKVTKGDILQYGTFVSNLDDEEYKSAAVSVYWGDAFNMADAEGVLFNVTFEVSGTAQLGEYTINANYEKGDINDEIFNAVMPDILTGTVTIADTIKGDINLDRKCSISDLTMLSQYLAEWPSIMDQINGNVAMSNAANVHKDSRIDARDGTRLAQLLLGYDVPESKATLVNLMSTNSASPISLSSTEEPTITVESIDATVGEYIYIPVTISDNTGISGADFTINFDSSKLTPISVTEGDLFVNGSFSTNISETKDNSIAIHWSDADNVYEDGTMFILEFLLSENAEIGETLPIELTCKTICDCLLNMVNVSIEHSKINVIEYTVETVEPELWLYYIDDTYMELADGTSCESIPANGDFDLNVDIESSSTEFVSAILFVATYDDFGRLISVKKQPITEEILHKETCEVHIDKTTSKIDYLKIFIWDSVSSLKPVAETLTVFKTTE